VDGKMCQKGQSYEKHKKQNKNTDCCHPSSCHFYRTYEYRESEARGNGNTIDSRTLVSAVDSFSDLLYQLQQGETDYELSYRRAICNFYALYHGVIFLSDIHNRDCSYKREMNAVYAYLLTRSEIDAETVEIIRTACQAIGRKESESSIGEWLLRARNSMME
jgi:hypothetical protein